jgi:acetyl-CoA acyltransferase
MTNKTFVVGVGMTPFTKPQTTLDVDFTTMVKNAATDALNDAGLTIDQVESGYAGYVLGESCSGHWAIYELGMTGMPIYNVNSNCSSGSSAISLARQAIGGGYIDVALTVGFEKMTPTVILPTPSDRTSPLTAYAVAATSVHPLNPMVNPSAQIWGNAASEHMERYGSRPEHYAMVGEKNHRHAAANPNAQYRDISTLEEVMAAPQVHGPLTRLQCSGVSSGAAAAILMSEAAVDRYGLRDQAVEILGQGLATDTRDSFDPPSAIMTAGFGMTERAARKAFEESGVGIEDVDVVELHDCFSPNEILTYEGLGMAPVGKGHLLLEEQATTYGGQWVVNPSGGLIGKGHPLGATGIAQCAELSWQLRGAAGERQVDGARTALQHNLGLGGTAAVTIYRGPNAA